MSCRHYVGSTEPNFSFSASQEGQYTVASRSLAEALMKLPPKSICDRLYGLFLSAVHPLTPLVHLPTLDDQYRRFWEWYQGWDGLALPQGVLVENPSFLPLLISVLFSGSIASTSLSGISSSLERQELQMRLYNLASDALVLVGFPHNPSLYSLMAYLLLQSLLILEEESLASISFVTLAFRVCQAMGLHKDGTNFNLDPIVIEERRRVWRHVLHLDVMTSVISGLPPVANLQTSSTIPMLSELRDQYIGSKEWASHSEISDSTLYYPGYILAAGRYDATHCIHQILLQQSGSQAMTLADVESSKGMLGKLRERTEARIRKLSLISDQNRWPKEASHQAGSPSSSPSPDPFEAASFDTWSKDLLQLTVEKGYCILYQPLMKNPSLWSKMRPEAILHFQTWLHTFLKMCSTKSYSPFQWLYPGAYQPLQASAVLLIDLMNEPTSEQAFESRILLERVFSLLGPDGRVSVEASESFAALHHRSKGANTAWARLEKLRRKVWRRLGLDSTLVWTRGIVIGQDGNDDHWMGNSPPLSSLSDFHFDPAEQSTTCVTADVWPLQEEVGLNQPVGRLDISLSSTDAISTTFTPIDSGMFTAELATGYPVAMAQAGGAWFGLQGQTTELPSDIVVSDSVAPNMMGWTDTNT
jgi:Fungal specific transcription factor domain